MNKNNVNEMLKTIKFLRNDKEFNPTKREMAIVLDDLNKKLDKKDARIADLEKENEQLNTKLEIWNRFDKEDYIHRGENTTDRDYYYYTNGASTVLENEVNQLNHDLEVMEKELAELKKNVIVLPYLVNTSLIKRSSLGDICIVEFGNRQEAEEALKKLKGE